MVSVLNQQIKYAGLSTDAKPTVGVLNGDLFFEINTGDTYLYDFAGEQWVKQKSSGGGGSDAKSNKVGTGLVGYMII